MLGVRESRRVVARYTLTEHDLRAGLSGQAHGDIVAVADHAVDVHGAHGAGCGELAEPYGVPFRCLQPVDCDNLLVPGRAAGFSAIAASSCRLSRTMLQLGVAAGRAVCGLSLIPMQQGRADGGPPPPAGFSGCLRRPGTSRRDGLGQRGCGEDVAAAVRPWSRAHPHRLTAAATSEPPP